jgi:hypothetical protein
MDAVGNDRDCDCDCNRGELGWDRSPAPVFPCCCGGGGGDASSAFAAASSSGSPIKLPVDATTAAAAAAAAALNGEGITGIIVPMDDGKDADVRRRLGSGLTRRRVVISGTLNIVGEPAYIVACLITE